MQRAPRMLLSTSTDARYSMDSTQPFWTQSMPLSTQRCCVAGLHFCMLLGKPHGTMLGLLDSKPDHRHSLVMVYLHFIPPLSRLFDPGLAPGIPTCLSLCGLLPPSLWPLSGPRSLSKSLRDYQVPSYCHCHLQVSGLKGEHKNNNSLFCSLLP